VEFIHPFILDEIDRELPAGRYTVETEEETLDGASFLAWRRLATHFFVRPVNQRSGAAEMWAVHPDGLESALQRDRLAPG
jgi:hypothetical protein